MNKKKQRTFWTWAEQFLEREDERWKIRDSYPNYMNKDTWVDHLKAVAIFGLAIVFFLLVFG